MMTPETINKVLETKGNVTARDVHGESVDINHAIGLHFTHPTKQWRLNAILHVQFGVYEAEIPVGYIWNGADIPRLCWSLIGVNPHDRRVLIASCVHDWGCENENVPQKLADGMFASLLEPITFNGYPLPGVGKTRAALMYYAVRTWSVRNVAKNWEKGT